MEQLTPSVPSDEAAVTALLRSCGLPCQDVARHLASFTVARDGGRVVGALGLEVHGTDGLLRSLAVAEDRRHEGIARRLYASVLGRARQLGVTRLYVLPAAASLFFEVLGFRVVPRDAVPDAIRATEEFRSLGVDAATCLARTISPA